jgi:hypothetical protein
MNKRNPAPHLRCLPGLDSSSVHDLHMPKTGTPKTVLLLAELNANTATS